MLLQSLSAFNYCLVAKALPYFVIEASHFQVSKYVLVIYCWVINYHIISSLKQCIFSILVFPGQLLRYGLPGSSVSGLFKGFIKGVIQAWVLFWTLNLERLHIQALFVGHWIEVFSSQLTVGPRLPSITSHGDISNMATHYTKACKPRRQSTRKMEGTIICNLNFSDIPSPLSYSIC